MTPFSYFLEANIYLAICLLSYRVLLRHETYFTINRWFLLGSFALSLLVPFIKLDWFIVNPLQSTGLMIAEMLDAVSLNQTPTQAFVVGDLVSYLYWAGVVLFLTGLLYNACTILRIIRNNPITNFHSYKLVVLKDSNQAFTFGRYIFWGDQSSDLVLKHEAEHVYQKHYIDVWLTECILLFFWFNPAVYLLRRELKRVHEYLADREVSAKCSLSRYAEEMVNNVFMGRENTLVNSFYKSNNLKIRLIMLMKKRSSKWAALKYAVVLPVGLTLVAISSTAFVLKENSGKITVAIKSATNVPLTKLSDRGTIASADRFKPPVSTIANSRDSLNTPAPKKKKTQVAVFLAGAALDSTTSVSKIEKMPEFPGGVQRLAEYIKSNINLPSGLDSTQLIDRMLLSFVVQKDGSISGVKVLRSSGSEAVDAVALKTVSGMPKWSPALVDAKPVSVQYTLPVALPSGNRKSVKLPPNVLYVLDGKLVKHEQVEALTPDQIASIEVLKGENAEKQYGVEGRNGVIIITLKK